MSSAIYLDNHASTQVAPESVAAMNEWWSRAANASSQHRGGLEAANAIVRARQDVAALVGASPAEITFTSGATEADNLAIGGVSRAARKRDPTRRSVIVSSIEHKAVISAAQALEAEGFEVKVAPATSEGVIDLALLEALATPATCLISVMAANNEIGTLQPLREVARIARNVGALFHTDAAQAAGRVPLDVFDIDIDYMSLSAHKMHGPQGIGALFVSASAPPPFPILLGGGQESGLRSGTLPTALIVGFGIAASLAKRRMTADAEYVENLARDFKRELRRRQCLFTPLFEGVDRTPGSLALAFHGVDSDHLAQALANTVHLSTGSACNAGDLEHSHVLTAVALSPQTAGEFTRVLFSRYNAPHEVGLAAEAIAAAVRTSIATGRSHQ